MGVGVRLKIALPVLITLCFCLYCSNSSPVWPGRQPGVGWSCRWRHGGRLAPLLPARGGGRCGGGRRRRAHALPRPLHAPHADGCTSAHRSARTPTAAGAPDPHTTGTAGKGWLNAVQIRIALFVRLCLWNTSTILPQRESWWNNMYP